MDKSFNLEEIEKGARTLINEDGLLYVFVGLLLLLVGVSFVYRPLLILDMFGSLLIFPLEALRRRFTYPRLGYVKFAVPPGTVRGILSFAAVCVIVLVALAFVGNGRFQRFLPAAYSAAFSLAFYFGMSAQGLRVIDWFLIALTLLTGIVASWLYADWHEGAMILFIVSGLIYILFGLIKFAIFLREYPVIDADID